MHPSKRSRVALPVATAGLPVLGLVGLALLLGCGRDEAQAPPKLLRPGLAAVQPPPPEVTPEGQPGLPQIHIQADALVTAGTSGHQAQVFGDDGLQYQWFIQGGSFESDATGSSVTWTAAGPGEVRLFCQGTNAAGKRSVVVAQIQAEAPPAIDRFESSPAVLTAGKTARLSWGATEVKTLTLDPGGADVTAVTGPGYPVKPAETTRYTLTATNAAGASVTRTLDLKVVPPPAIASFRAQGAVSLGQALTLHAQFSGGKGEIRRGDALLASGGPGTLQAQVASLKAGDTFSLTVTSESGDSATRTLNFNAPTTPQAQTQSPAPPKP